MIPRLFLYSDEEQWIRAQAACLRAAVDAAVREGRTRFHVCLSGGRTPEPLYRFLAADLLEPASRIEMHFWIGDERDLPSGDRDRNDTMIASALAGILKVSKLHPWPAIGRDTACIAYGEELRGELGSEPVLDFTFLGMGADGHTAGIFTLEDASARGGPLAHPSESPLYPRSRMTLAAPVLRKSARLLVSLRGDDKKKALETALHGGSSPIGLVAGDRGMFHYLESERRI